MNKFDGGPAFPVYPRSEGARVSELCDAVGMSIWDYYFGQAMIGLLAGNKAIYEADDSISLKHPDAFVTFAAKIADAMLEARKAKNDNA